MRRTGTPTRVGSFADFASRIAIFLTLGMIVAGAACAADPRVALDTSMGRIVVEVDPEHAPVSTKNFLLYVAAGHYNGTLFHRVVENFVIQGGGLDVQMHEKPARPAIVNEANNGLSNRLGTVAMAREAAIDSATAQFFINVADNPRLDHVDVPPDGVTVTRGGKEVRVMPEQADRVFGYAVFGHVVEGMDVVERIRHAPVHTVGEFENVPIENVIIIKAALLPPT